MGKVLCEFPKCMELSILQRFKESKTRHRKWAWMENCEACVKNSSWLWDSWWQPVSLFRRLCLWNRKIILPCWANFIPGRKTTIPTHVIMLMNITARFLQTWTHTVIARQGHSSQASYFGCRNGQRGRYGNVRDAAFRDYSFIHPPDHEDVWENFYQFQALDSDNCPIPLADRVCPSCEKSWMLCTHNSALWSSSDEFDMKTEVGETPLVGLLIQGGPPDINHVLGLLSKNVPVIVICGQGMAADILAFAFTSAQNVYVIHGPVCVVQSV